jgi:hypothetical protein
MKAGTANPEKTFTTRQRQGKHDSMVRIKHATDELLDAMFSMWSVQMLYKENQLKFVHHTSHMT